MKRVADTISYAANITIADVAQMSESFKYAAPAAVNGIDPHRPASAACPAI